MIMIERQKLKCRRIKMINLLANCGMDIDVLEEYFESKDHGIMASYREEKKKRDSLANVNNEKM